MKVLYVGDLTEHGTCRYRLHAMIRIGLEVQSFDTRPYTDVGGRIGHWLRVRLLAGPTLTRLNRAVVATAAEYRPDIVWFDKPVFMGRSALHSLRALGCTLVNYVIDNPFFTLPGEPGWRLLRRTIPHYDINVVPRPSSVADYRAVGAAEIVVMPLAFEPFRDFPPPPAQEPEPKTPVAFIGAPHGNRAEIFAALAAAGVPLTVRGDGWRRFHRLAGPNLTFRPFEAGDNYRRAIWDSAVLLGMVTHGHREPWAHRAFEITAAGGFLLAERTEGHLACFAEGQEAEFFASVAEGAEKANRYRKDARARRAIARAGCKRAWTSGYSNDERLAAAFAHMDPALGAKLMASATAVIAHRRAELGLS